MYNGSFEQYDSCPDNGGQVNRALYWFSANNGLGGSAEYFNACDNPGICGVPNNFIGGHHFAKTGNAYAGIMLYENVSEYREYIEGILTSPLQTNAHYYVSFHVSLSNYASFGIDALGAYFTNDSLITHSALAHLVDAERIKKQINP